MGNYIGYFYPLNLSLNINPHNKRKNINLSSSDYESFTNIYTPSPTRKNSNKIRTNATSFLSSSTDDSLSLIDDNDIDIKHSSMEEVKSFLELDLGIPVFIIGGGNVYEQFMNKVDKLYVTHIHHTWEDADTFFPEIDPNTWQCVSTQRNEADEKNPYPYTFAVYTKK